MSENYIKSVKKSFPKLDRYLVYNKLWVPSSGKRGKRKSAKQIKDSKTIQKEQDIIRNCIRAKTAIHDIVASNSFNYFVTLTLKPSKEVDRYDYDSATTAVSKYLKHNIKRYILVPEKHKDGAFHFHLLADLDKIQLKTSRKGSRYKSLKTYKLGYSSVKKIQQNSEIKIANYMQKYITKDLISSVPPGRKRYWASKGLVRPTVTYNIDPPIFSTPDFLNKRYAIHNIHVKSIDEIIKSG